MGFIHRLHRSPRPCRLPLGLQSFNPKIDVIVEFENAAAVAELRSFLGLFNVPLSRFESPVYLQH